MQKVLRTMKLKKNIEYIFLIDIPYYGHKEGDLVQKPKVPNSL